MHPILFSAGPITIYSYGVLLASAYLLGLWMAVRRANAAGINGNRIMDLLIWVIIAALVGAKALLFIVDFKHFTSNWQDFTTLLRSGGVFYGGLIAAIVVCIWQLRKHRLPLWPSGLLAAPHRNRCVRQLVALSRLSTVWSSFLRSMAWSFTTTLRLPAWTRP